MLRFSQNESTVSTEAQIVVSPGPATWTFRSDISPSWVGQVTRDRDKNWIITSSGAPLVTTEMFDFVHRAEAILFNNAKVV